MGANRIVFGGDFTHPAGDPSLPLQQERIFKRNILLKALEALQTVVTEPTLFKVKKSNE